jgi:hypothetical protein
MMARCVKIAIATLEAFAMLEILAEFKPLSPRAVAEFAPLERCCIHV